jgi:hypothetical protein
MCLYRLCNLINFFSKTKVFAFQGLFFLIISLPFNSQYPTEKTMHFHSNICLIAILLSFSPVFGAKNALADSSFINIDAFAKNDAPELIRESVPKLAEYLTNDFSTDLEKVRSIYIWIVHNIKGDMESQLDFVYNENSISLNKITSETVLKTRKAVCAGYSQLFADLCSHAGIEARVIVGTVKSADAFFGVDADQRAFKGGINHAWNAVKIDGSWFFIENTYGAAWGLALDPNTGKSHYNPPVIEYFFRTPPERMIMTHFPEDPQWQLLSRPVSNTDFENGSYFSPGYFIHNLTLLEPTTYRVNTNKEAVIRIDNIPENANVVAMTYVDAYFKPDGTVNNHTHTFFVKDSQNRGLGQATLKFPKKGRYIVLIVVNYKAGETYRADMALVIEYQYQ